MFEHSLNARPDGLEGKIPCRCRPGAREPADKEHRKRSPSTSSYKQGGLAACSTTARVKRTDVEALILAEVESEILSDEAVTHAQKAVQQELSRLAKRNKAEPPVTQRLTKPNAESNELRAMLAAGRFLPTALQAALDAMERERAEIPSPLNCLAQAPAPKDS